jgi:hypothetical protein
MGKSVTVLVGHAHDDQPILQILLSVHLALLLKLTALWGNSADQSPECPAIREKVTNQSVKRKSVPFVCHASLQS